MKDTYGGNFERKDMAGIQKDMAGTPSTPKRYGGNFD